MGDDHLDLEVLCRGAQKGNEKDLLKLLKFFDKDLRKRIYIGGRFNEDVYQEMRIKLLKCIQKFEYKSASLCNTIGTVLHEKLLRM